MYFTFSCFIFFDCSGFFDVNPSFVKHYRWPYVCCLPLQQEVALELMGNVVHGLFSGQSIKAVVIIGQFF